MELVLWSNPGESKMDWKNWKDVAVVVAFVLGGLFVLAIIAAAMLHNTMPG